MDRIERFLRDVLEVSIALILFIPFYIFFMLPTLILLDYAEKNWRSKTATKIKDKLIKKVY